MNRESIAAAAGASDRAARAGSAPPVRAIAPVVRRLGPVEYRTTYEAMQRFTAARTPETPDELWVLEHPPVYTVGLAAREEHFPRRTGIALERIDRGGQITYHGPGQAVIYTLVDLPRRRLQVRSLVSLLEQAVIDYLAGHGVAAARRVGAPGVYVDGAKIAALGLRIRRGCAYHGLALNVDMDLAPFTAIDPCGYPGLAVTQARDLGIADDAATAGGRVARRIATALES
ncbi:MAG: lipoyl(octanoyl) transferase LipB [Burkholderiales bacterium]|nr:lipoyl(octanoyl) transferase LipB [Burkholderiales bacterium]